MVNTEKPIWGMLIKFVLIALYYNYNKEIAILHLEMYGMCVATHPTYLPSISL